MPRPATDPRRRCLRVEEWPVLDRRLWQLGTAPGDGLDDPPPGAGLSPWTLRKLAKGYGRWLGFLVLRGWLEDGISPGQRVTPERADALLRLMRDLGNCGHTILGRFRELRRALRILEPQRSFTWLTAPHGAPLRAHLAMAQRPFVVPSASVLFRWGLDLIGAAPAIQHPIRRAVQVRDGLLIAILASRAPRLRTLAAMRLGSSVVRDGDRFRLVFGPEQVKTRKRLEYLLPAALTRHVEQYLAVERAALLGGKRHDAFWVKRDGSALSADTLAFRVLWRSRKRFGAAFGPHRFRYAIGSSMAHAEPESPGVAAAVLGISERILRQHYDRASQERAAAAFHAELMTERDRTDGVAARAFRDGEG